MTRSRSALFAVAMVLVCAGLATRSSIASGIIATYGGDTLWATLVFTLVLWVRPRLPPLRAASIALALAFLVEFSQLLHWPMLVALRSTRLGGLVLGHGFLWSDLACYTVGVLLGVGLDWLLFRAPRTTLAAEP